MADNFDDVAVGDKIVINDSMYDTVVSVSKTRFKTARGYSFYKADGIQYTSGWNRVYANKPTDERCKKVEYKKERSILYGRIMNVCWKRYNNATLKHILKIIDDVEEKSAETKNENKK